MIVARAIAAKLDELGANEEDLAMCGGACGGYLLFAEECLKRGLHLHVRIPFEEPEFLEQSVDFAGDAWRKRFTDVKQHKNCWVEILSDELGYSPTNPYARNNLCQLNSALTWGGEEGQFYRSLEWQGRRRPRGD